MQTVLATFISTFKVGASQNSFKFEEPVTWYIYVIKIATKFDLKEPNFKKLLGVLGASPQIP